LSPRPSPATRLLGPLVCALLVAGCAPTTPTVPPVSPTSTTTREIGNFVWYDLLTTDVPAAQRFYGELFGWSFDGGGQESPGYITIVHDGRPIGAIVASDRLQQEVNASQWVSSLSVQDVDETAEAVERLGGSVVTPPRDLPERGRVAVVRDNQGALLALLRSSSGDPPVDRSRVGGWLWTELWTRDVESSLAFYRELMGYEVGDGDLGGNVEYRVLESGGTPRAGILPFEVDGVQPNWLPYVLVDDPQALAARVETLGGRVLIAPRSEIRNGSVALIADPSGAALTIQKWPPEGEDR
jgi:predicted enzyme related to lactoylglutathione lyase